MKFSELQFLSMRNTDPSIRTTDMAIVCTEKSPSSVRPQVWSQAFLHTCREQDNIFKPFCQRFPKEHEKTSTQKVCDIAVNTLYSLSCCYSLEMSPGMETALLRVGTAPSFPCSPPMQKDEGVKAQNRTALKLYAIHHAETPKPDNYCSYRS